ncbi:GNAT family N-acetyltransferase [Providencia vermicola]|uniref:N-acetyltransferase n=2 Tax=Providencia TaxID=586 RepID=A0AAI9HWH1_PROST|nr:MULTISPECIES: N-acetyltransferase [Providencia]ELR5043723.1 N-acetyltransferase [Providencia rettgeri]ELR5034277.1 N-acetyltransferase [Providencia stuartii]ELR5121445.1 N-acetyltransferase [Providencia stuartii]ELR5142021.1 N-acetyltransferase [Providencia stuartii]ELR5291656.1 N-acetyltransferase [Providencia stuartii]
MLIRVEIPVDAIGIDKLLRETFPTQAEAELVHKLREDGLLTLGVVATNDDGEVIGYVGFTPVDVNNEDVQWVGLAPIAVSQQYQNQGIGSQLIYEGLDSLNEFGYGAVVVVGDSNYYRRFGFEPASQHNIVSQWPELQDHFMICGLENGTLSDHTGRVTYSAHFDAL